LVSFSFSQKDYKDNFKKRIFDNEFIIYLIQEIETF
jgi:hypothetical protein